LNPKPSEGEGKALEDSVTRDVADCDAECSQPLRVTSVDQRVDQNDRAALLAEIDAATRLGDIDRASAAMARLMGLRPSEDHATEGP
jgi:hypothetical protein